MQKTTVYLDTDVQRTLRRLADARGKTQSAVIRDAVLAYAGKERPKSKLAGSLRLGRNFSERSEEILKNMELD